jgi:post-segregation antitoxin (ccd killing protein)
MEKRELQSLVVKKESSESEVVSIRLPKRLMDKLRAKEINIASTVKAVLQRIAD